MFTVLHILLWAIYAVQISQGEVAWSEWSSWSDCSTSCGEGIMSKTRECLDGTLVVEKKLCGRKSSLRKKNCPNTKPCPIDGGWGEWSEWTDCSVTCDEGNQFRERKCDNPLPQFGGEVCEGTKQETKRCYTDIECARDGEWSAWSKWSQCPVTCGRGRQRRERACDNPPPFGDGRPCLGSPEETRSCNSGVECPVDGDWSEWSDWSPCRVTCGTGEVQRKRKCNNPAPRFGGKDCEGKKEETKRCRHPVECPVNGAWSEWGPFTQCTSTCRPKEKSFQFRTRSCNNPRPRFGGQMCQGSFMNAGLCPQPTNCPVDGDFGEWSDWKCLDGLAKRTRECNDPPPQNGGKECPREDYMESFDSESDPNRYRDICGNDVEPEPCPDCAEDVTTEEADNGDWEEFDYE